MHKADDDRATIAKATPTWPVGNAERAGESAGYAHMPASEGMAAASEEHMVGSFGEAPAPAGSCEIETVSVLAVLERITRLYFFEKNVIFVILMLYL